MAEVPEIVSRALVQTLRWPSRVGSRAFFDLDVEGSENLPMDGPVVIAANHFSLLDPWMIATSLKRYTRYMALDDLFKQSKVFAGGLGLFGAISLDRDGYPVRAMREAIEYLGDGGAIGLFPEGRRVERWGQDPPKRGAAWLARKVQAPLLPVAIVGTQHSLAPGERSFARTAVKVWIEEPIQWDSHGDAADPIGEMMDEWFNAVNNRVELWV